MVRGSVEGKVQGLVSGGRGGNVALDLFVLSQHLGGLLDEALRESGLSPAQYAVYSQIAAGISSPKALLEVLGLRPATLSGYLNAMEARGDLVRTRDPTDGRAHVVTLTSQGSDRNAVAAAAFLDVLSALDEQIGGQQVMPRVRAELFRIDEALLTVTRQRRPSPQNTSCS